MKKNVMTIEAPKIDEIDIDARDIFGSSLREGCGCKEACVSCSCKEDDGGKIKPAGRRKKSPAKKAPRDEKALHAKTMYDFLHPDRDDVLTHDGKSPSVIITPFNFSSFLFMGKTDRLKGRALEVYRALASATKEEHTISSDAINEEEIGAQLALVGPT